MIEKDLLESLKNTAFTTGAGANCFFQGFIHTLCYTQEPDAIDKMSKFLGSKTLLEIFNQKVPELKVTNINDLILLAKAMHPLERELIFGPLMRDTLNKLALEDSNGKPLTLDTGSIIFPPHAIAFAHAFGFSYDEYTHINDSEGMPIEELKPVMVGDYYLVRHSLENNAATLVLRLKSCHFEVGGINPGIVALHQSKIKLPEEVFHGDSSRPELPGARFYEQPSPDSDCAVKDFKVDFDTALSLTLSVLRFREGEHQKLMAPDHDISTTKKNFFKFKETYQSELGPKENGIEKSMRTGDQSFKSS
ncbi:MAG: hypothetical protein LCH30_01760 [Proteobacteria bacterium]|nr:hypothetical protein [Pseudomonadota bacterium]